MRNFSCAPPNRSQISFKEGVALCLGRNAEKFLFFSEKGIDKRKTL